MPAETTRRSIAIDPVRIVRADRSHKTHVSGLPVKEPRDVGLFVRNHDSDCCRRCDGGLVLIRRRDVDAAALSCRIDFDATFAPAFRADALMAGERSANATVRSSRPFFILIGKYQVRPALCAQ